MSAHEISRSAHDRHNIEALMAQQAVDAGIADLDGAERAVEVVINPEFTSEQGHALWLNLSFDLTSSPS